MSHRRRNIVLVGFMGSGKSSIGRLVAGQLGFRFVDTDAMVVQQTGQEIADIFREHGEARFRDLETQAIEALQEQENRVIATGGGAVLRERNRELLRQIGVTFLLTASEDVIFERVSRNQRRPLLQTADPRGTVARLLAERAPAYAAAAEWTLDTTALSHAQAAAAVIEEARRRWSCEAAP